MLIFKRGTEWHEHWELEWHEHFLPWLNSWLFTCFLSRGDWSTFQYFTRNFWFLHGKGLLYVPLKLSQKQVDQTIILSPVERVMFKKSRKRDKHHKPCGKNWIVGPFIHTNWCSIPFILVAHSSWCSNFGNFKWTISTSGSFWAYTRGTPPISSSNHRFSDALLPFFWGGGW